MSNPATSEQEDAVVAFSLHNISNGWLVRRTWASGDVDDTAFIGDESFEDAVNYLLSGKLPGEDPITQSPPPPPPEKTAPKLQVKKKDEVELL